MMMMMTLGGYEAGSPQPWGGLARSSSPTTVRPCSYRSLGISHIIYLISYLLISHISYHISNISQMIKYHRPPVLIYISHHIFSYHLVSSFISSSTSQMIKNHRPPVLIHRLKCLTSSHGCKRSAIQSQSLISHISYLTSTHITRRLIAMLLSFLYQSATLNCSFLKNLLSIFLNLLLSQFG